MFLKPILPSTPDEHRWIILLTSWVFLKIILMGFRNHFVARKRVMKYYRHSVWNYFTRTHTWTSGAYFLAQFRNINRERPIRVWVGSWQFFRDLYNLRAADLFSMRQKTHSHCRPEVVLPKIVFGHVKNVSTAIIKDSICVFLEKPREYLPSCTHTHTRV